MRVITNKKGFTLIELLIVITIIGILAVAFLPSLLGSPAKARDVQRMEDVKKIAGYVVSSGTNFPTAYINSTSAVLNGLNANIKANLNSFGGKFPQDPVPTNYAVVNQVLSKGSYIYYKYTTGDYSFGVFAKVEDPATNGNFDLYVAADLSTAPAMFPGGKYYGILMQK
ncbi:MAG: prepilin-type N-terminal cleavage/methylation domain-containing protein [Candidatus Gracilibacteria bacterium]